MSKYLLLFIFLGFIFASANEQMVIPTCFTSFELYKMGYDLSKVTDDERCPSTKTLSISETIILKKKLNLVKDLLESN